MIIIGKPCFIGVVKMLIITIQQDKYFSKIHPSMLCGGTEKYGNLDNFNIEIHIIMYFFFVFFCLT